MPSAPQEARLLWPDPESGPWLVRVWLRAQHGVPTAVGLSVTSWRDEDPRTSGPHNALPEPDADVALPRVDVQLLRRLPIGALVEAARQQVAARIEDQSATGTRYTQQLKEQGQPAHAAVAAARLQTSTERSAELREALASGRRGRDLGDEHYRQVAAVYAEAVRHGRPPTTAVALWLAGSAPETASKSTAAKQVARARARGFLPKTSKGRPGPATEEL